MAVYILDTRRALIDDAINMHGRVVGALMRRSQRKCAEQLQEDGTDPWALIEDQLNWDDFCEAESLADPEKWTT